MRFILGPLGMSWWLPLCVLANGCGEPPNHLEGSIDESHSLAFDTVKLQLLTSQARYEFRYEKTLEGGGIDVVAKLVFDQPAGGVVLNQAIDLITVDAVVQRVTVANDPFPDFRSGQVEFSAGAINQDEQTTGTWTTTLENGKTLNGGFDGPLDVIAF
jgi:hypothetical protein